MDILQGHTCTEMQWAVQEGESALIYIPEYREFGIRILDGGTSFQVIAFCPWCGVRLPESLRDEWLKRLGALGMGPDDPALPESLQSDSWWRAEGL